MTRIAVYDNVRPIAMVVRLLTSSLFRKLNNMATYAATTQQRSSQGSFWLGFGLTLLVAGFVWGLFGSKRAQLTPFEELPVVHHSLTPSEMIGTLSPRHLTAVVPKTLHDSSTLMNVPSERDASSCDLLNRLFEGTSHSDLFMNCTDAQAPLSDRVTSLCTQLLKTFSPLLSAETGLNTLTCIVVDGHIMGIGVASKPLPML